MFPGPGGARTLGTAGRAERGSEGLSDRAVRQSPALPRPGTAAGSTPEQLPSHSAARPAARATGVPPRRGSLTPVTLRAGPGAAGVPRQAPHGRPAALRGARCPLQPFHHTHERARRAAEAPLPAEGDGCRGRAEPGLELPVAVAPGRFGGQ